MSHRVKLKSVFLGDNVVKGWKPTMTKLSQSSMAPPIFAYIVRLIVLISQRGGSMFPRKKTQEQWPKKN